MEEHTLTFIVDHMLGKLAKYLRMVGLDAVYFTQTDVSTLIKKASQEKRTILSRNARLKKITGFPDVVFINDNQPDKQLSAVLKYFKIHISPEQLFTRCLTCNQKLIVAHHEDVEGRVTSYIFETHKEFFLCPQCKKVYWEGTHLKKMKEIIREVLGEKDPRSDFIDA